MAIITLAHNLEFESVAEGVETKRSAIFCGCCRCDEGQGYLFGKPMPADVFESTMRRRSTTKAKCRAYHRSPKKSKWQAPVNRDRPMNPELHALVIDDEQPVRDFVATVLRADGWQVTQSSSAEEAFEMSHHSNWAVVFCDVMLGGANGFEVLRRFKQDLPETKVVLMTGHGSGEGALDATAFGAYDYLLKPFGPEELQSLSSALREQLTTHRNVFRRRRTDSPESDINLIGRSQAFIEVMKQVGRVAATNLPVLLTGESGTGKELIAAAIHRRSGRADKPFVAVNCGAIPAELIESELFGHTKGSFTGADRDRRGLWEEADGGTVFLDEITETTPAFQVKLLRVIQEGEIRRVGSNQTRKVDVRIVAASNRNVEEEVSAGRFRNDLFYRLNAVSIVLPPLRERREDIPPLAQSFARRIYSLSPSVTFSTEAVELLERYHWPGNIRELENAVVRGGGDVRWNNPGQGFA